MFTGRRNSWSRFTGWKLYAIFPAFPRYSPRRPPIIPVPGAGVQRATAWRRGFVGAGNAGRGAAGNPCAEIQETRSPDLNTVAAGGNPRVTGEGCSGRNDRIPRSTRLGPESFKAHRVHATSSHGWSQRLVAEAWSARWPDDQKTFKNISYWEQWPGSTGHAPSLESLERLACIYECSVSDLLSDRPNFDRRSSLEIPGPRTTVPDTPGFVGDLSNDLSFHCAK